MEVWEKRVRWYDIELQLQAHLICQPSANSALSTTLLIEEADKVRFGPTTFIVNGLLVVLGEELNCGVTGHAILGGKAFVLLVVTVNVGDDAL